MKKLTIFKRVFADLWRLGKKYYVLFIIQQLALKSAPFIGFIYMTQIVDALTANELSNIPNLIIQYLVILLVLQIVNGIVEPLVNNEYNLLTQMLFAEPNKKMLSMHYYYAESSKVREQLENINRQMMRGQPSLAMIQMRLQPILSNFVTVVWSLILLFPIFNIDINDLPVGFGG